MTVLARRIDRLEDAAKITEPTCVVVIDGN
jgi:hypothetical protein